MAVEQRIFGPTKHSIPVIGQGTWNMERDDHAAAIAALRAGMELGMTHLDTAELYGRGVVEEKIVAPAIAGRRDQVFLVSKVMPANASRAATLAACDWSLRRLRTDRLDCYLLHWAGPHPLEDTIAAFEQLVKAGKIKSWGVSNFDVPQLEAALRLAGPGRIACNQVVYHLQDRAIEQDVIPWCEQHDVAVVGYSPFGSGRFPSAKSAGGQVLAAIAAAHGATARQVALRFLIRRPSLFAIPKASRLDHVRDNAAAAALTLTADELRRIDEAFPL